MKQKLRPRLLAKVLGLGTVALSTLASAKDHPTSKADSAGALAYQTPDGYSVKHRYKVEEFFKKLSRLTAESGTPVTYSLSDKTAACPVVYAADKKVEAWPHSFCLDGVQVKSIVINGTVVDGQFDVFSIMEQIVAKFPEVISATKSRLKGTELEKILAKEEVAPIPEFFGGVIYQPTGEYFLMGIRDLCGRLSRTHRKLAWRAGPIPTQYYLTMESNLSGESLAFLFQVNKTNVGTAEKPEYAPLNQLMAAYIMEKSPDLPSVLAQFKALEKLAPADGDRCPGS